MVKVQTKQNFFSEKYKHKGFEYDFKNFLHTERQKKKEPMAFLLYLSNVS